MSSNSAAKPHTIALSVSLKRRSLGTDLYISGRAFSTVARVTAPRKPRVSRLQPRCDGSAEMGPSAEDTHAHFFIDFPPSGRLKLL